MPVNFSDIQDHWAKDCILQLAQRQLAAGYPDGSFQPDRTVSRAEFAALIQAAFPNRDIVRNPLRFGDVFATHWASIAIQFAYQTRFVAGYPDYLFKPDAPMLRVQAIASISSGLHYPVPAQPEALLTQYFDDAKEIPDYAVNGIAAATGQRLVVNYPHVRELRPNHSLTRGELAALLCRALRIYSVSDDYIVPVAPSEADPDRHIVLSAQLTEIDDFSEDLAKAVSEDKNGFINHQGNWILPSDPDNRWATFNGYPHTVFSEGLAAVRIKDRYGYVNKTGEIVIQPQFTEANPFKEGSALVAIKDPNYKGQPYPQTPNLYGYINREGEYIAEPQFIQGNSFEAGLASVTNLVENGFEYGFINPEGERVIRLNSMIYGGFYDGLASFRTEGLEAADRLYGYIDKQGTVVIQPQFKHAGRFSEGRAWVTKGFDRVCIDTSGNVINPTNFNDVENFSDGRAWACIDTQCGYLYRNGRYSQAFNDIRPFSEGLAAVKIGEKQGFIDREGNLVIAAQYEALGTFWRLSPECDFSQGRALIRLDGQYGYIDKGGNRVIDPQFDEAHPFSEGLAAVRKGDQNYYIDREGETAFYSHFPTAQVSLKTPDPSFTNGLAVMEANRLYGFIDKTGKIIIPPQFSQVDIRPDGSIQVNLGSERKCRIGGDTPIHCWFEGGKWGVLRPKVDSPHENEQLMSGEVSANTLFKHQTFPVTTTPISTAKLISTAF